MASRERGAQARKYSCAIDSSPVVSSRSAATHNSTCHLKATRRRKPLARGRPTLQMPTPKNSLLQKEVSGKAEAAIMRRATPTSLNKGRGRCRPVSSPTPGVRTEDRAGFQHLLELLPTVVASTPAGVAAIGRDFNTCCSNC
nr:uncharacterized protein LOC123765462 isoform X1 [Procambarus clarkii]